MTNTVWSTTDKLQVTLSGGNLTATSTTGYGGVRSVDRQVSGKYYWENTVSTWGNAQTNVGVATAATSLNKESGFTGTTQAGCVAVYKAGTIFTGGISSGLTLGARAAGDIIGVALDLGAQLIWFRAAPSGNWNGSGTANPATGAGGLSIAGQTSNGVMAVYAEASFQISTDVVTANFGDSAFSGTAPSGFTAGFLTGTPTLNAVLTQTAIQQWADGNPSARLTQLAVEQWSTPTGTGVSALLTQIAVEHWGQIAVVTSNSPQLCIIT